MIFRVEQKVVCIWDGWVFWPEYRPNAWPCVGQVYVVREIETENCVFGGVGLRFHSIVNRLVRLMPSGVLAEPSFASECDGRPNFRPVVETKTDISIFTRMLTPTDKVKA